MSSGLINPNPVVYERAERSVKTQEYIDSVLSAESIFEFIRDIRDPEHPYSLEQLKVVDIDNIYVDHVKNTVKILYTPTVEHCSMASLIGLSLKFKLIRELPLYTKIDVAIYPGTHISEKTITKQINDKERVAAALENPRLLEMIEECIRHTNDDKN